MSPAIDHVSEPPNATEAPPDALNYPPIPASGPADRARTRAIFDAVVKLLSLHRPAVEVRAGLLAATGRVSLRFGRLVWSWAGRSPSEVERSAVGLAFAQHGGRAADVDHMTPVRPGAA